MKNHHVQTPFSISRTLPAAIGLAFVFVVAFAVPTSAQNADAPAVYGELNLHSPFKPDPVKVAVSAGGRTNARTAGFHSGCTGFFNPAAPLVRLNYKSSGIAMQIYVGSAADTTLIIRGPDGQWHCDDDSLAKNPAIRFSSPKSGAYDIWVGAFGGGRPEATLYVTEQ